jgi:hypothetical protein
MGSRALRGARCGLRAGLAESSRAFEGRSTEFWLAAFPIRTSRDPHDFIPYFAQAARASGCRTEPVTTSLVPWRGYGWYGLSADCSDGTIALVALDGPRLGIGCLRPTTLAQCEDLLREIHEGKRRPVVVRKGVTSGEIVLPPSAPAPSPSP